MESHFRVCFSWKAYFFSTFRGGGAGMGTQFDECSRQHLDFIQSNIARMNGCSFQMKGWTGTIIAALLAVYAAADFCSDNSSLLFAASGIIPLVAFAFLDAYYLNKERQFRNIYNDIICQNNTDVGVPLYTMPLDNHTDGIPSFVRAFFSVSVIGFYLPLALSFVGVITLSLESCF